MEDFSGLEIGVLIGGCYWKFLKIKEINENLYIIFPIPEIGLHLSVHSKNEAHPNIHAHIKSEKLGIEEDVDPWSFSETSMKLYALELLNGFRLGKPDSKEVLVIPPFFWDRALVRNVRGRREKFTFDLNGFLGGLGGTWYKTQVKRIPLLVEQLQQGDQKMDYGKVLGISRDTMVMMINSDTTLEFVYHGLFEQLGRTGMGEALVNPMSRAFDLVLKQKPNIIDRWVPKRSIENFAKYAGSMNPPEIVDF